MKNKTFKLSSLSLMISMGIAASSQLLAQDFTLGMSSPPTSMDPQFYNLTPNNNVASHMFEPLVKLDAALQPIPGLAESWKLVYPKNWDFPTTWEFKLRKGVKFHDGSDLTAEDVVWSLDRPATIIGSPGKFDGFTKEIISKEIVDNYTIRVTTEKPYPLMLQDLSNIFIVSKKATQGVKSEEFASGKGMIGTGPFKFVKFLRDDRVELVRNDSYWGKPAAWNHVTLRFLSDGSSRLAALLAGDVQAIENVPSPDVARIRTEPKIAFFTRVSGRLIYFYLDTSREKSPFVTDKAGAPLAKNPLQDLRVRRALSMAINREGIKDRVMEGLSEPTNNLVPAQFFGYSANLKTVRYDPEGAKKLLAEAGYPGGFGLTIHTPNNRYVNDEKITQTVAQMWSKIGIDMKVEALPMAVYAGHANKGEYSAGLLAWIAANGEVSSPLRALLACPDMKTGYGAFNAEKYCNPKVDDLLKKALATIDDKDRSKLLQDATELAINDVGLIPLHHQVSTWAAKKGITYAERSDESTSAYGFRPQ